MTSFVSRQEVDYPGQLGSPLVAGNGGKSGSIKTTVEQSFVASSNNYDEGTDDAILVASAASPLRQSKGKSEFLRNFEHSKKLMNSKNKH